MSLARRTFEDRFAAAKGVTVEDLGRRGWWSGLVGGEWVEQCVPPEASPEKRRELLGGMIGPVLFGQTPPISEGNGAGAGAGGGQ